MKKITPFLWFDGNAYEAVQFYTGVFKNSKITGTIPAPGATVMTVTFELDGQEFIALNGGPMFSFTEAVSFFIKCDTQEEIDELWSRLTADGGKEGMCGWLTDKYGLSWQVAPPLLGELLADKDPARAERVMQAMMQMKKIVIADLEKAAA
jgi:predicted 3-demethylubiquinone-9 3-methyltransferase (glyoxalase superfamily)